MAKPKRRSIYMYVGLVIGLALGALFGGVEYGEPWLGALVGSGLAAPIGILLQMRFGQSE